MVIEDVFKLIKEKQEFAQKLMESCKTMEDLFPILELQIHRMNFIYDDETKERLVTLVALGIAALEGNY